MNILKKMVQKNFVMKSLVQVLLGWHLNFFTFEEEKIFKMKEIGLAYIEKVLEEISQIRQMLLKEIIIYGNLQQNFPFIRCFKTATADKFSLRKKESVKNKKNINQSKTVVNQAG